MKTPPYLKPGSKIRIVSPAGKVDKSFVLPAVLWLDAQGYKVELGKHVFSRHYQFAGTDKQRLHDLQSALDDPDTKAIICSRGGYGTVRIIDKLNFSGCAANPKWLIGFSDITILHTCFNKMGASTIHGAMPRYFFDKKGEQTDSLTSLINLLTGEKPDYIFPAEKKNRTGKTTAQLAGGNLSIISSLMGTKYELDTYGKILFLEDIDEFLYHSDRMMHQLKLAGKLDNLAGLLLGNFTEMKDNESPFGRNIREIISEVVSEYDYPVCFGFPAGHDKKNLALAFGQEWELKVTEKQSNLKLI